MNVLPPIITTPKAEMTEAWAEKILEEDEDGYEEDDDDNEEEAQDDSNTFFMTEVYLCMFIKIL